jgi:two-component system, chemotaxis family, protein-glutamate methylesterase/glutaminase
MSDFRIVVIGGSAGAVEAVIGVATGLPADLPAAVLIAVHISPVARSALAELIGRRSALKVASAHDGDVLEAGRIYVAPPDCHLLVEAGHVSLGHGPRENGHRPAIDPLFRTAAHNYGPRVVGVILSGNLDDGAMGLREIRRMGGRAIVQNPADALYDEMPRNAIDSADPDVVAPVRDIAQHITRLVAASPSASGVEDLPPDIAAGGEAPLSADERESGELSPFGCPDCGGALWQLHDGELVRYRCRVGHAYTEQNLLDAQFSGVDRAMWAALRALEESASNALALAKRMRARGHEKLAGRFTKQAMEAEMRAVIIRRALLKVDDNTIKEVG